MKLHDTLLITIPLLNSQIAQRICWFGITGLVDGTSDESIFFYLCHSIFFFSIIYNDWWIINFPLEL